MALLLMACQEQYPQGKRLYEHHCSSCHMNDGTGLGALLPPLKNSDFLAENLYRVPCIIRNGLFETITVNGIQYSEIMIGFPDLNPIEISNIMHYITSVFLEDKKRTYKIQQIEKMLEECDF